MRINGRNRVKLRGAWVPDRNDEYLFYQTLIGAWQSQDTHSPLPDRASSDFVARLVVYMQKAAREAKVHTSWIEENREYSRALLHFVEETLAGRTARRFLAVRMVRGDRVRPFQPAHGDGIADLSRCTALGACP